MAPKARAVDTLRVAAVLASGGTLADAAREQGVHESTLNNRRKSDPRVAEAWDAARAQAALDRGKAVESSGQDRTMTVSVDRLEQLKLGELQKLAEENGVDLAEWTIRDVKISKWGQPGEESRQVTLFLRPRIWIDDLRPAPAPMRPLKFAKRKPPKGEAQMIVVHGDDHAPYHDEALHEAFCRMIGDLQPHVVIHHGDLLDLPTISRHRDDPSHAATPNECIDAGAQLLYDRRSMVPDSRFVLIRGNHDDRIRTELLARAERMYGIRRAALNGEEPSEPVVSLRELLRLDEMGIELAGDDHDGEYFHDGVTFGETLEFRHGFLTGKKAAADTVERLGRNVFFGHTHHKRDHFVTRRLYGQEQTLVGVEVGPMCHTDRRGASYAATTDWHAGCVVVFLYPDGHVDHSHARWTDGALRWRGQSWRP